MQTAATAQRAVVRARERTRRACWSGRRATCSAAVTAATAPGIELAEFDQDDPGARGEAHGELWRGPIQELVELRGALALRRGGFVDRGQLEGLAARHLPRLAREAPALAAELAGIARGAGAGRGAEGGAGGAGGAGIMKSIASRSGTSTTSTVRLRCAFVPPPASWNFAEPMPRRSVAKLSDSKPASTSVWLDLSRTRCMKSRESTSGASMRLPRPDASAVISRSWRSEDNVVCTCTSTALLSSTTGRHASEKPVVTEPGAKAEVDALTEVVLVDQLSVKVGTVLDCAMEVKRTSDFEPSAAVTSTYLSKRFSTSPTSASQAAASVTSSAMPAPWMPASASALPISAAPDSEVAVPTTVAPRRPSSSATARPMPRDAPVTSATGLERSEDAEEAMVSSGVEAARIESIESAP